MLVIYLQDLWVNFRKDQLFCLLGPNGAGKTTIINCLTGITPVTGGDGNTLSFHNHNYIETGLEVHIILIMSQILCINSLGLWTFRSKHGWHVRHPANYRSVSTGALSAYFQQFVSMPRVLFC